MAPALSRRQLDHDKPSLVSCSHSELSRSRTRAVLAGSCGELSPAGPAVVWPVAVQYGCQVPAALSVWRISAPSVPRASSVTPMLGNVCVACAVTAPRTVWVVVEVLGRNDCASQAAHTPLV